MSHKHWVLCGIGDAAPGFTHARQEPYGMSYSPSLEADSPTKIFIELCFWLSGWNRNAVSISHKRLYVRNCCEAGLVEFIFCFVF